MYLYSASSLQQLLTVSTAVCITHSLPQSRRHHLCIVNDNNARSAAEVLLSPALKHNTLLNCPNMFWSLTASSVDDVMNVHSLHMVYGLFTAQINKLLLH